MAGKANFNIKTPASKVVKVGNAMATLTFNSSFGSQRSAQLSRKQAFIDNECIRRMNPETPRLTGALIKAATIGTVIGSGEINQKTPYARRQYYEHKTKSYWFERMKNRHKDSILRGAEQIE